MLEKEQQVQAELQRLNQLLDENEIIIRFREVEARVQQNKKLDDLVEQIKQAQKDAVQYAHYDKPEAEKQALELADTLTKEFDEHPLVIAYREQLLEANDLIQHLTKRIHKAVNHSLEKAENL